MFTTHDHGDLDHQFLPNSNSDYPKVCSPARVERKCVNDYFSRLANFLIPQNGILLGEEDSGPINPHTGQFTAQDQGSVTISIISFVESIH